MPLEKLYHITEICVGIGFMISIVFLALQIRQNSTLLRHSMTLNRRENSAWMMRAICTDSDFRDFHSRIASEYENFNDDEKYRADSLAMHNITSNLDELLAYKRGLISKDEWTSLKYILEFTAARPNIQAVYERVKHQYPKEVQEFWETLPKQTKKVQPMLDR
tara:strand:- start:765 stop:1253 length:489 start_codon:yes stop_codon:yes gene_type:complete